MERDRTIEILLALTLVVLLIILILLFTNFSTTGKSTSSTQVINSYNTENYNTYPTQKYSSTYKKYYYKYYEDDNRNYDYIYISDSRKCKYVTTKQKFDYSHRGYHDSEDNFIGGQIDTFEVYVRNKEHKGGYFKVKFHFEDYYGEEFTRSIKKYIKADDEEKFFYRDVHDDKHKYYRWSYDIIPESDIEDKNYVCYYN